MDGGKPGMSMSGGWEMGFEEWGVCAALHIVSRHIIQTWCLAPLHSPEISGPSSLLPEPRLKREIQSNPSQTITHHVSPPAHESQTLSFFSPIRDNHTKPKIQTASVDAWLCCALELRGRPWLTKSVRREGMEGHLGVSGCRSGSVWCRV